MMPNWVIILACLIAFAFAGAIIGSILFAVNHGWSGLKVGLTLGTVILIGLLIINKIIERMVAHL